MKTSGITCLSRTRRSSWSTERFLSPKQYSTRAAGVVCAVLAFSSISNAEELVSFPQLEHKPQLDRLSQLPAEEQLKECYATAEFNRSDRDLEFFKVSRKLSSAKSFFVSHSIKNEKLFCSEIELCNRLFPPVLDDSIKSYQECGA